MFDAKFKVRSKKYLRAAKDQSCVNCGVRDGTVVSAHYEGFRSHLYGKGKGAKPHDLCVADLCFKCHNTIGSGGGETFAIKVSNSEQFLHCIILTLLRRAKQGVIYTDDIQT